MRAPVNTIPAPLFPSGLPWVNADGANPSVLQRGRPLLVEFWDFCRPNSIRTLPYLKAWHERYAESGLRTIGVHCPGFECSRDEQAVREAVARLAIPYPVLIDTEFVLWREYENRGWPARYLFDGHARLFEYHYGEGGYEETERAICELLDVPCEPLAPLRPEDAPGARIVPQSEDREGAWSGAYAAGGVWAVLDGSGTLSVTLDEERAFAAKRTVAGGPGATLAGAPAQRTIAVEHPGAYPLVQHERHTEGTIAIRAGEGVECLATCFTPGLA